MVNNSRMSEQELLAAFDEAIENDHIFAYFQPQVNHSTGRMVGAEALMRWKDPERGMQYPSDFIPVLENNDLIYKADLHLFDLVCRFIDKCIDEELTVVPISVNLSRYDIYDRDYVEEIEKIRQKYDVPVKYLRIEITESSAIGGIELVKNVLDKLHGYGYLVEMDDFGSGYSSLNILKDLDIDIIKLDMIFMSGKLGGRGGTILNSIIQMAKWLQTPVIAEGVETMEMANFLKSMGCNYIQGYLYSKPLEKDDFLQKIKDLDYEPVQSAMQLISDMDNGKFWDPDSMEAIIFSNFVGPAVVMTYDVYDHSAEIHRVNEQYVREIGRGQNEYDILNSDPWECFDEENLKIYEETIKRAIASDDEEMCETWRSYCTKLCGEEKICIRSHMRVVGKGGDKYLIYSRVRNVTTEKKALMELNSSEHLLRYGFEHANVYAWEVDLSTFEMHPCFRCMRDLGLPPVVKNYPEPVIESGLFPADYADMYRDWMKQMRDGVDNLEAVIPLTAGRIPFIVRYTLEYDENGKPLKAYGSATLVVDNEENVD